MHLITYATALDCTAICNKAHRTKPHTQSTAEHKRCHECSVLCMFEGIDVCFPCSLCSLRLLLLCASCMHAYARMHKLLCRLTGHTGKSTWILCLCLCMCVCTHAHMGVRLRVRMFIGDFTSRLSRICGSATLTPTFAPSQAPSVFPTLAPSRDPTLTPSLIPSDTPTAIPSLLPSTADTYSTKSPTISPSV